MLPIREQISSAAIRKIDGQAPKFEKLGPPIPVRGHDGWTLESFRHGPFTLMLWRENGALAHAHLVNRNLDRGQVSFVEFGDGEVYPLSGQSGYSWSSEEWIKSKATDESNPFDAWFEQRIAADATDPNVTKETGSGNMEWWSFAGSMADHYGTSPALLAYLVAYAHKAGRRPRNLITQEGVPSCLYDTVPSAKPFDEWGLNAVGLNAWDLQHLDGMELWQGYRLTRDPFFLWHLVLLWSTAWRQSWYLEERPDQSYGGSPRTVGWYLVVAAHTFRALSMSPDLFPLADGIVLRSIAWHARNAIEKDPIGSPWFYGTPPPAYKVRRVDYEFPWQSAVAAWGLQEAALAVRVADPQLADECSEGAADILYRQATEDFDASSGRVVYCRPAPGYEQHADLVAWHDPTGVGYWLLPPLLRSGPSDDLVEFASVLLEDLLATGWQMPESDHHPKAISYAAPALGFPAEVMP
ncbi:MAG: hypothetical protein ACF8XB_12615 [Planctomycetota bacterium JB042]